ncbi:MAG: ATP-binding protein [Planctomycetaceae bacterium]|nr:ATP-binding protein [Planctomycetaceae bacterium]
MTCYLIDAPGFGIIVGWVFAYPALLQQTRVTSGEKIAMTRRIFLSMVSDEFRSYRELLTNDLERGSVEVSTQEKWGTLGSTTLDKLDKHLQKCDAIIHVVGDGLGHIPPAAAIDALLQKHSGFLPSLQEYCKLSREQLGQCSYTQIEAYLAVFHKVRLHIYRPDQTAPRESDFTSDADQRESQRQHFDRIRNLGRDRDVFLNQERLSSFVLADLNDILPPRDTRRPLHLPYQSIGTLFKGRETFLQQLRTCLQRTGDGRATAVVGKAVHGLGGVGKTRLAVEYAWQHADDYNAVLCVTADSPENLQRNLAKLTGPLVLDLPEHSATEEEVRVAAALRWLQAHPGWFLILDNVDDKLSAIAVEDLLTKLHGGHVVITSRLGRWSDCVEPLELDVLSNEDGKTFLLKKTESKSRSTGRKTAATDDADALELAAELDGLALALEQAAAYIVKRRKTFQEYLTLWRSHAVTVQKWLDRTIKYAGPTGAPLRSVAITWQTTLDQLGDDERTLLNLLAWFAPEPVPLSVFTESAVSVCFDEDSGNTEDTESTEEGGAWDAERLEAALANLADYSMLRWDVDEETVTVHRVVQEILRTRQDQPQHWLTSTLRLLQSAVPAGSPQDVRTWPAWEPLRPHVAFAVTEGKRLAIAVPTSDLMGKLGTLLWAKALHKDAEVFQRDALAIDEQQFGPESTQVAVRLNNLAQTLQDTNRLSEAEPLMRRALSIDEQSYGDQHPNVARDLNNLAQLLQATNRLSEAEPLMRRALSIERESCGEQH